MLKTAIFDMDGVIVNSHPVHRKAWCEFFTSLGLSPTEQELQYVFDGHKREEILRFFLGDDLSPAELRQYGLQKDRIFARCAEQMQPIAGVCEFIRSWGESGVRLAVASSASRQRVASTLEQFDLTQCFSAIVTGDDVANGKPDPAIFQTACQQLDGAPEATLVIEDAVSGVKGARAAGMKCLGVADSERARLLYEAGAHFVVPDFKGLGIKTVSELFEDAV